MDFFFATVKIDPIHIDLFATKVKRELQTVIRYRATRVSAIGEIIAEKRRTTRRNLQKRLVIPLKLRKGPTPETSVCDQHIFYLVLIQ